MNHGTVPLRELPVLAMDCQATSSSTKNGHLIDIAWAIIDATGTPAEVESTTVALPDDVELPRRIARLTGISPEELEDAPAPDEVAARLRADLETWTGAFAVAHWARFEAAFVERLLGEPLDWICTHDLFKRLVPGLPRKGLRAVSGYFGRTLGETKRAAEHVEATAFVWRELIGLLEEEGVFALDELWRWLERPVEKTDARTYPLPREMRLGLPDEPGVYRMLGRDGKVLYVGKASSLKDRVNSYFRQRKLAERKMELVSQVWDLDVTLTESALEAALLEADEIKRLAPPYNRQFRRRHREIVWAAEDDFGDVAPRPTSRHVLGPFSSRATCDRFAEVIDAVNEDGHLSWFAEAEAAIVAEGIRQFRQTHELERIDTARLLALGHSLHPLPEEDEAAGDDEGDDPVEIDAVTVDAVVRTLEWTAVSAYQAVQRGRWLRRLCESRIRWTPHHAAERVRELQFEEDPELDIDGYDRLSVLLVELRRIVRDGRDVVLNVDGETLDSDGVANALARF